MKNVINNKIDVKFHDIQKKRILVKTFLPWNEEKTDLKDKEL